MELIAVVIVIFCIASILSLVTKIDIAYLFAPSIFLISGWEYAFGLAGFLNLGMEFLTLVLFSLTLYLLARNLNFRNNFFKNLIEPSTFVFFTLSLVSLVKSNDWLLQLWDEFTHWGHIVKTMYEYATLGPATPVDLMVRDYPPALSLFQYFVMDFSSEWREGLLFWAIHLLAISIIVSVLARCSFKSISSITEIIVKLFVSLVAASAFFNLFDNIYADPLLAIVFGFTTVIAVNASRFDGKWSVIFAISAGYLTMIKSTGLYFAMATILVSFVATICVGKKCSIRDLVLLLRPTIYAFATVMTAWLSWSYYLQNFGDSSFSRLSQEPLALSDSARAEFVTSVTSSFVNAYFHTNINPSYSVYMPAVAWTFITTVFFVVWATLNGKKNLRKNLIIGLCLLLSTAGYFGLILYSYLNLFGPGEAAGLASYSRYISTWYQGIFFAIVVLVMSEFNVNQDLDSEDCSNRSGKQTKASILLLTFVTLTILSSPSTYVIMLRTDPYNGSIARAPFEPIKKAISKAKIPENSKVYIIAQHTVGFEYYVLRYEMTGAQFGKVPWSIGTQRNDGDIWTEPTIDVDKWSTILRDFDFVVMYSTTESFNTEFASIFEFEIVEPNTVYKVVKLQGDISLKKVS